jgi:predicted AlkP superfamily phosphohydrolase/phosphomutase
LLPRSGCYDWRAMRRDTPVILLGLDAADIVLIERWAAQGFLPTFASLFSTAAHGRLDTSATVLQASVWPSFATACNPGKHGSYFQLQMRNATNTLTRVRSHDLRRPPFWTWLEGPRETAVVIDVPKMPPFGDINGVQVVEWGATDHYGAYATVPTTLAGPLRRQFGTHPLLHDHVPPAGIAACLRLKKRLVRGVGMKHRLHLECLTRYRPRVFVSVFGESHPAGHYFWRFTDESHPDYCRHAEANAALLDVYAALDRAVGEVFNTYSRIANCFVFSGHGMTAAYHPHTIVDELLCRMELTVRGRPALAPGPDARNLARSFVRATREATPEPIRRFASRYVLPRGVQEHLVLLKTLSDVDFSRTQAFALPTDLQGFIRVNLQGREPQGTVSPQRYDSLCDSIVEELESLRDAATDERVVETVFRPRVLYRDADSVDHLPDLCVLWKNAGPVSSVYSPRYGTIEVQKSFLERSGNHRLEGFWFAAGPDIDTRRQHCRGQMCGLAPTVFHLLQKPIPDDWDGRPLPIA